MKTTNTVTPVKQMSLIAYLGLCSFSLIVVALIFALGGREALAGLYAQATASTIIGFWIGKTIAKNKQRDWKSIIAFPIITLVAAVFGFSISHALAFPNGQDWSYPIVFLIALGQSYSLFIILNRTSTT